MQITSRDNYLLRLLPHRDRSSRQGLLNIQLQHTDTASLMPGALAGKLLDNHSKSVRPMIQRWCTSRCCLWTWQNSGWRLGVSEWVSCTMANRSEVSKEWLASQSSDHVCHMSRCPQGHVQHVCPVSYLRILAWNETLNNTHVAGLGARWSKGVSLPTHVTMQTVLWSEID